MSGEASRAVREQAELAIVARAARPHSSSPLRIPTTVSDIAVAG
jgi:hypothetical protein